MKYDPDVIILNNGDAQVLGHDPIIMDKKDVYEAAPRATIIAGQCCIRPWRSNKERIRENWLCADLHRVMEHSLFGTCGTGVTGLGEGRRRQASATPVTAGLGAH